MITHSMNAAAAPVGSAHRHEIERSPHRYLVVANLTVAGEQLAAKVQRSLRAGPCSFHVVVPASPDPHAMTWTEHEVRRAAERRLNHALTVFRVLGADVSGEVGDWSPLLAIEDVLRSRKFDEIIVSTLSPGLSRWIRLDLPRRVANRFGLPVSHVISPIDGPLGGDGEVDSDRMRTLAALSRSSVSSSSVPASRSSTT